MRNSSSTTAVQLNYTPREDAGYRDSGCHVDVVPNDVGLIKNRINYRK